MLPVNDIPQGLHAGDYNGDGAPDVIVADQGSQDLTILRNAGSGHFAFWTSISATARPRGAVCADFSNDGLSDVAASDRDAGIAVIYLQKATGGFQKTATFAVGKQPNSVQAADLDHDGNMDFVVISTSQRIMSMRFGDGTGAFPRSTTTVLPMRTPVYAAIGDFNLDNNLDIAVAGGGNGSRALIFYMGDGHGIFTLSSTTVPSLPIPHTISMVNLDNDGIADLAVLSRDGTVTIYLGSASGSFTLAKTLLLPQTAQSMDFADFDGDGILDMAAGLIQFNSVMILRGLGGLKFVPLSNDLLPDDTIVQPSGSGIPRTETFDDNTPSTDIVRVNNGTRALEKVDIAEGTTMETVPLALVQDPPTTVLLADMNNDGVPDAVVATHGHRSVGLEVFFGNTSAGYDVPPLGIETCGNGVLEPGQVCGILGANSCKGCVPQIGATLVSIAAGDFDGDGNQDLVVVGAPGRLWLLLGNGKGQFSAVRMLGTTATKMPAVIGDFDGDGALDIVAVLHQAGARGLTLLRNDGTGNFTNTAIPIDATVKGPLLAADFDRNGAMDLAVETSGHRACGIALLFNDGSGAMPSTMTIPTARGLQALSAADFNEDGWLDLLGSFGSGGRSTMMLYTGQPGGQFANGVPAIDGGSTGSVKSAAATIVDVNDDSHQDVVVCRSAPVTSCNPYFGTGTGSFLQETTVSPAGVRCNADSDWDADTDGDRRRQRPDSGTDVHTEAERDADTGADGQPHSVPIERGRSLQQNRHDQRWDRSVGGRSRRRQP
ncbi:MAG: VCBS repeat-containing protein [Deltaproteobacteria bacterium]|nr:VCBS repeat-containing protein [Deltaproteobacteria bacterium]